MAQCQARVRWVGADVGTVLLPKDPLTKISCHFIAQEAMRRKGGGYGWKSTEYWVRVEKTSSRTHSMLVSAKAPEKGHG